MVSASTQSIHEHHPDDKNVKPKERNVRLSLEFGSAMAILGLASIASAFVLWLASAQHYPQLLTLAGEGALIALGMWLYQATIGSGRGTLRIAVMLFFALGGAFTMPVIAPSLLPMGTAAAAIISLAGWALLGTRRGLVFVVFCMLSVVLDSLFAQTLSTHLFGDALTQEFSQSSFALVGNLLAIAGLLLVGRQIAVSYETILADDHAIVRMLIDNLPDNVFVKDRDSRIIIDNAAHAHHLGNSTPEEVIGKSDFDFFPAELAQKYFDDEQQMIQSEESRIDIEEPTVDPEGNQHWLLTTKVLARDAENKVVAIVGINHDITALKQAELSRDKLYQIEQGQHANLEVLIGEIRAATMRLNDATAAMGSAVSQQAGSMVNQEGAIAETLATVEQVRATVTQTADRAKDVASAARNSATISRTGQEAVADAIEGMTSIKQKVENIAENILALSASTQQIDEIIGTVNAIAAQSKLLALNASIEAARAGAEGRGFAVVAMEVRKLAEQSREATARIQTILTEIQQATNTAVMATEEGSKGAEYGMTLVEQAGRSIRDLAATIDEASQAAAQIAASTRQQTAGMDQLSTAMMDIRSAAAQTVAGTRQMERSVQNLMSMAQELEHTAEQYHHT